MKTHHHVIPWIRAVIAIGLAAGCASAAFPTLKLEPVALQSGGAAIWDGRFEIKGHEDGWRVEALAGRVGALSRTERLGLKALPPSARSALPVLVRDGRVALPAPFGSGPADAKSLVGTRLNAACGRIEREYERSS